MEQHLLWLAAGIYTYEIRELSMKSAPISDLKKELKELSHAQIVEVCLRLAKYKKENKELLSYLIYDAGYEEAYVNMIKEEMDETFLQVNRHNIYQAKKTIRKILRITNKYIRFTGSKKVMADLLLYFCKKLKGTGIKLSQSATLENLYFRQLKNIQQAIEQMHEDLQHDYLHELNLLID